MNFNIPSTPPVEREPHWLTLEEICGKMKSFIGTRKYNSPRIKRLDDGLVTLVEYEAKNEDGSISVFSYIKAGPKSLNTVINVAHFRGNPDDGDWLGGGGTLSNYDEKTGKWSDVEGIK